MFLESGKKLREAFSEQPYYHDGTGNFYGISEEKGKHTGSKALGPTHLEGVLEPGDAKKVYAESTGDETEEIRKGIARLAVGEEPGQRRCREIA